MAATKRNAMLIDEAREKIRTTQLINRLQDHALGKVKMTATQVRSVEVLLKKAVPDLSSVTLKGDEENPLVHKFAGMKQSLGKKAGSNLSGLTSERRSWQT